MTLPARADVDLPETSAREVRAAWLARREVALVDVREEADFARAHPAWAANLSLNRIELDAWSRLPRREVDLVVYGSADLGDARRAARRFRELGYTRVSLLRDGLAGWAADGGELFTGLGVPGRAYRAWRERSGASRASLPADRIDAATLAQWRLGERTTCLIDVRPAECYAAGHIAGFRGLPADRLLARTDTHLPVRGARIVLADHGLAADATMAASGVEEAGRVLAGMGWEVALMDAASAGPLVAGPDDPPRPPLPACASIDRQTLSNWLAGGPGEVQVIDVTTSQNYLKRHIPGAWFALRSQLPAALAAIPPSRRVVLTCATSILAWWVADDLAAWRNTADAPPLWVLEGGTNGWLAAGLPGESGATRMASPPIDRYRPVEDDEPPDFLARFERDDRPFREPGGG